PHGAPLNRMTQLSWADTIHPCRHFFRRKTQLPKILSKQCDNACAKRLGLRRLDAAFGIVLTVNSRRRRAAAVQGASRMGMQRSIANLERGPPPNDTATAFRFIFSWDFLSLDKMSRLV